MVAILSARGPVTAIACLSATATWGLSAFFVAMRQTTIDCATGSATGAACGVDILETVVSALIAIGSTAGAVAIGLTSPTPRDVSDSLVFRVDGEDIDWHQGMANHRFGTNHTYDNPAVVEFQHNATSRVHKYFTYINSDGNPVMRHPTGLEVQTSDEKRSTCEAYFDIVIYGDNLRSSELSQSPTYSEYLKLASVIFEEYSGNGIGNGCLELQSEYSTGVDDPNYFTQFAFGASCAHSIPIAYNCRSVTYNQLWFIMSD